MGEQYPPYPTGARDSLFVALAVAIVAIVIVLVKSRDMRKEKNISWITQIWDWLKNDTIIRGSLLAVMFIALWLTVRAIGFQLRFYFVYEEHVYNVFEVLDLLAYVLAISLCLTLVKSTRKLREIVSAAFQSVLLALLVFLPRATSPYTIELYGQYGSAVIMIGFSALLMALAYISKHFLEETASA